jgi:hypothetical protein
LALGYFGAGLLGLYQISILSCNLKAYLDFVTRVFQKQDLACDNSDCCQLQQNLVASGFNSTHNTKASSIIPTEIVEESYWTEF